jgi:hypothetical protein
MWLIYDPGFEPLISSITTLVVLLGLLFIKSKSSEKTPNKIYMNQKAGKKAKQYQSYRDMTINK